MSIKLLYTKFLILLFSANVICQTGPEMSIQLLANDNIAKVNINQDSFVKSIGGITDIMKKEFAEIPSDQKIGLLLTVHKTGKPSFEFYSNPSISEKLEKNFLDKLKKQELENTKLVDFPMFIALNSPFENQQNDFKEYISPIDRKVSTYQNANLKEQYELNKSYAIEILPILSAFQTIVDDQFKGVKNFGKLVTTTDFSKAQNITKLSSNNSDYWRAIMEMSAGNQLIPVTKIFMLASQGELDLAKKYIEIIKMFSEENSVPDGYLYEMESRLNLFNKRLDKRIEEGITYHDKGEYQNAIDIYEAILGDYPNSAWARYELYYSQNALALSDESYDINDRDEWDEAKIEVYKRNPLYNMDVRASSGEEGYLLVRRSSISSLFKERESLINDVYKYADIAMDLGVYDFAANLFWISSLYKSDYDNSASKFLYCIEKCGVPDLKENFKGDYKDEFKEIDKAKEKAMKESEIYKSFKK